VVELVGIPNEGNFVLSCLFLRTQCLSSKNDDEVFNVGNARRQVSKSETEAAQKMGTTQESSFFDPKDPEKCHLRDQLAMQVLDEMIEWLNSGLGFVLLRSLD